ncbi:MAG: ACT domain-containing protein [Spirulinaceae cyanobacterium RM2_2_10]|nr:ACT domain-containing protein [Spirulinaceae cyanobacterium SM2_1_0]NJO21536.1 ACT domain-containing protein [Spirulinaceae cyanobacterium RM2_2_10]
MTEQRWVFVVRALDKPGTLAAAAAVFSQRGVSLESILGSGISSTGADGRLVFSLRATARKQALLQRVVGRLAAVSQVEVYAYDDLRLRAIAVVRTAATTPLPLDAAEARLETISRTEQERILLLTGSTTAVESALGILREQGSLCDVVTAAIAI